MKKLWKKVRKGSPARSGEASPKSGSTRGSVASLNIGYEVREKDLGKLHKAAWIGDLNKVKQLAKKDPSPLDKENRTPLHLACVQGNEHIVQELLEWKAKANIGDNQSRTPLMRAVEFQQEGCVNLLLGYRVDIDIVDAQGYTPLHLAVEGGNPHIIHTLIKAGASLNAKNKEGFSPLHLAVRNKQEDVCRLLLMERADVNVEDTNLRTPLMYACQDGSISLVKLLLEYNADTVHKDSKGWSADDCAVIQGHHACSQLISDHNVKMSRSTPASTPRSSSQPPSILNTPRDKDSIGLPVADGGGDDSDNETISKASGAGGSDSWADSPDVSMGDEIVKKGAKEGSDIDEEVFDDEDDKPAAAKISLAKFAKSIHISESDTDGESVRSTPKRKTSNGSLGAEKDESAPKVAKPDIFAAKQTSLKSQTSAEDNSWNDSPITPRKGSNPRVSFKRDEELSEVHDIVTSTPASKSANKGPGVPSVSSSYVPSATATGSVVSPSAEKMRALMEELGISDVDDISETSEGAEQVPPLPQSPPPKSAKANQRKEDSEWDSSNISDIMTTPRPGILKKFSNSSLGDSREGSNSKQKQEQQEVKQQQPKPLLKVPAIESGDESSAWDTTEAENVIPLSKPNNQVAKASIPQQKDSASEWDSDLEDMVNPVTPVMATTPTPPPPNATITKEVEAIVRQKQAECQDSDDDEGSISPYGRDGLATPVVSETIGQSAKFYMGSSSSNDTSREGEGNINNKKNNDVVEDDNWDSTAEGVTPRQNAGLQYKEVNIGGPASLSESAPPPPKVMPGVEEKIQPVMAPTVNATAKGGMLDQEDEESDSNWDSEGDDLPSDAGAVPVYGLSMGQGRSPPPPHKPMDDVKYQKEAQQPVIDSDEDSETVSSWEIERKSGKNQVQSPSKIASHQREIEEAERRKAQEELEKKLKAQQEEEEKQREETERKRRQKEEEEEDRKRREREAEEWERERREQNAREEEERRRERERQEEQQRQWEIEEEQRQEQMKREAEELMKREEERERTQAYDLSNEDLMDTVDHVFAQQQELNRIDEQFQRERIEREKREAELEEEQKEEEELRQHEERIEKENVSPAAQLQSPPPALSPRPAVSPKPSPVSSTSSGVYVNIGSSAVQEIKQRLQIPATTSATTASPLTSTGPFHAVSDDEDSLISDTPGDERTSMPQSFYQGLLTTHSMYRPNDPLDDDALSYTSTEFEDPVQSTPAYAKDRDMLANINISDPSSLLKVQDHVRDTRRQLEQEKNQRVVLENKLKVSNKEKSELTKKLEALTELKSTLEQTQLDLEAQIRSLEYNMSEEEEKRKNAEILLAKTKEQLTRKESQYSSELEAKQRAELTMRNLQIKMRTAANTIKELEEEKEELQRQVTHANNARSLQEQINEDQHKLLQQQQQQQQQQQTPRDNDYMDSSHEFGGDSDKLKAELYALKMEMDRQRSRFKDEISLMGAENEELMAKVEDLRSDIKLNEEALAHASMQCNIQVTSLKTDIGNANASVEKERAAKEKLESEIDSLKTRLTAANQEMDKAIRARNEIEREYRRERESLSREMERKEEEIAMLKDSTQHLNQRLHATDTKLNSMENELHISNTSLMERTSQMQQIKQELDRLKTTHESLDQNNRLEKEHSAKLQAKVENLQEKYSQQQHENLSLRQQLDSLKLNAGGLPGSDVNEKLNNILSNLRADSDRARATLEEKNSNLLEQVARLKEEVRGSETRRTTLEQDLRRMHDEHSEMVKKLSHAEASLQIAMRAKEQLEQERAQLKAEIEKLQHRYQTTHDKSIEAQARLSELVDRVEKAENASFTSHQQLANTSANIQGLAKSKSELDESMQQLQIENARLEAELKYEKQRADMLYQDLQDSQKVRSSLEALCANLKSTSAHLEDRLGSEENGFEDSRLDQETAARVMYESEARDHKTLYDQEMKSRSKLGLRIADLERNKQTSESQLGEEKKRSNIANEERRTLETRLESEMEKNQQLQKEVNTLKVHLKSAKNKLKETGGSPRLDPRYADFRRDVNNVDTFVSTPRHQAQIADSGGDVRAELEAKYRLELNRKLDEVNRFLDSQSHLRDRLDTSRTETEAHLLSDKRRLEEEINNLRVRYEQAVSQRETKEMEAKRFRELYESEMKWRMRISDQLQLATEKGFNLKSKLNNERHHRNRLTGSIGNLNSSIVSNNSFDLGRVNGFQDDDLSNKIKAELDRSIAKHLEAAPHDHNKPVLRPTKDPPRFSSSLTQSTQDYIDILKRKYCL